MFLCLCICVCVYVMPLCVKHWILLFLCHMLQAISILPSTFLLPLEVNLPHRLFKTHVRFYQCTTLFSESYILEIKKMMNNILKFQWKLQVLYSWFILLLNALSFLLQQLFIHIQGLKPCFVHSTTLYITNFIIDILKLIHLSLFHFLFEW